MNPDWLDSLLAKGKSPLLTPAQLEFIADVRKRIIREAKPSPSFLCDNPLKFKLSVLKDNFERVVKYLKKSSQSREYFVQTYPEWRMFRNLTIIKLQDVAETVKIESKKAADARTAGNVVSLIGGIICIATGAAVLRLAGGLLMGLGTLTTAGASVEEVGLLQKKIKDAEKIIQEDKEYSEKLWNWISDVSHIQKALNTIQEIHVDRNLKKAAVDLYACFKKKRPTAELEMIIKRVTNALKVNPETAKEISNVVGILIALSMLCDLFCSSLNLALEVFKCEKVLSTVSDVIGAGIRVRSAVNVANGSNLTKMQKFGIGIGIASDALSIINAAGSENSTSKEAEEITKAAETLKKEAEVFKKLFEAVKYL